MAEGSSSGGGIDRKADERMEFSTSKEVTVHPTFESMSLKGEFGCFCDLTSTNTYANCF
jgi:hypothetical protein